MDIPLQPQPVGRGQLCRMMRRPHYIITLMITAIIAGGMHFLVGWVTLTHWNKIGWEDVAPICLFPQPDGGNILLCSEVFIDATLTGLFVCMGQAQRMKEVSKGRIAAVSADAFPPRRLPCLVCLFPRGLSWRPNLTALLGVAIAWGLVWGTFTFIVLLVLRATPLQGFPGERFCLNAITYNTSRMLWSGTEALLVAAGSYFLWAQKAAPKTAELNEPLAASSSTVPINVA